MLSTLVCHTIRSDHHVIHENETKHQLCAKRAPETMKVLSGEKAVDTWEGIPEFPLWVPIGNSGVGKTRVPVSLLKYHKLILM